MMLTTLLRFPDDAFPRAALTGDAVLDRHLAALDARLLGGANVRVLVLAEIKDHLLERKAALLPQVPTETAAAQAAVDGMEPVGSVAERQRADMRRRFLLYALQMGPGFFVVTSLLNALQDGHTAGRPSFVIAHAIMALFFGLSMAWWITFVHPPRVLPLDSRDDAFSVGYAPHMRRLAFATGLGFLAMSAVGLAALIGIRSLNPLGWNRVCGGVFFILSLFNLRNLRHAIWTYRADGSGFSIERWFRRERVPWGAIKSLRPLGEIKTWIPSWNYWSKVVSLEYAKPGGHTARINVFPDTANADRFILMARRRLERGAVEGPAGVS